MLHYACRFCLTAVAAAGLLLAADESSVRTLTATTQVPPYAARVVRLMMTASVPSNCQVPVAASEFFSTAEEAYLWFSVEAAAKGDLPTVEWRDSTGSLYRTGQWGAMESDGSFCLWSRLRIARNAAAERPGKWSAAVFWNGRSLFSLEFVILSVNPPVVSAGGIVNSADYTANLAPGALISIFGSEMAPRIRVAETVPLPSELDGVWVEIVDGSNTRRAPLLFVSGGQINAQLPYGISAPQVRVRVTNPAGSSEERVVPVVARSPRVFLKDGAPIVLHANYRMVSDASPAVPNEALVVFVTGLGEVRPPVREGDAAGSSPLSQVTDPVEVLVGNRAATVHFSGLAPGFAGLYQINFSLPAALATMAQPIAVQCGRGVSQAGLTIAVRGQAPPDSGPVSATIGSTGGEVQGYGLKLSVPVGAFSSNAQIQVSRSSKKVHSIQDGESYSLAGLPDGWSQDLTVTIETDVAFSRDDHVTVHMAPDSSPEDWPDTPDLVEAEASGSRLTFVIPARESLGNVANTNARRSASGRSVNPYTFWSLWWNKWQVYQAGSNNQFKFYYDQTDAMLQSVYVDKIRTGLESAVSKLQNDVGLLWPNTYKWPMRVYLYDLGTVNVAREGKVFWSGRDEQPICVNMRFLTNGNDAEQAALAAGHEVFHVLQNAYDPRTAWSIGGGFTRNWLWFYEASAVWFEYLLNPNPKDFPTDNQKANLHWIADGLTSFPWTNSTMQNHGYGASLFVQYLADHAATGSKLIGSIIKKAATFVDEPVEAINNVYPRLVPTEWLAFVKAYVEGKIYLNQAPDGFSLIENQYSKFKTVSLDGLRQGDPPRKLDLKLPQLSAQGVLLGIPDSWSSAIDLNIEFAAPDPDSSAFVYRVGRQGSVLLATLKKGGKYTLKDSAAMRAARENVLVMVASATLQKGKIQNSIGYGSYPLTDFSLAFSVSGILSVEPSVQKTLNELKLMRFVDLDLDVPLQCQGSDGKWGGCSGWPDLSSQPVCTGSVPLTVTETTFGATGSYKCAGTTHTVNISGSFSPQPVSSAFPKGTLLATGTFTVTEEDSKGSRTAVTVTVTAIPYLGLGGTVAQGGPRFEVSDKASDLQKYISVTQNVIYGRTVSTRYDTTSSGVKTIGIQFWK